MVILASARLQTRMAIMRGSWSHNRNAGFIGQAENIEVFQRALSQVCIIHIEEQGVTKNIFATTRGNSKHARQRPMHRLIMDGPLIPLKRAANDTSLVLFKKTSVLLCYPHYRCK